MGASLLVFANKTDVGNCMTDEEICQVCRTSASRYLIRYNDCRVSDWMQSKHTNGQLSDVVGSRETGYEKASIGLYRMPRTGSSSTKRWESSQEGERASS